MREIKGVGERKVIMIYYMYEIINTQKLKVKYISGNMCVKVGEGKGRKTGTCWRWAEKDVPCTVLSLLVQVIL